MSRPESTPQNRLAPLPDDTRGTNARPNASGGSEFTYDSWQHIVTAPTHDRSRIPISQGDLEVAAHNEGTAR